MPKTSVYVLYTGGTIGCVNSPKGLKPASKDAFKDLLLSQPGFSKVLGSSSDTLDLEVQKSDDADTLLNIDLVIDSISPAIDSSSMTPTEWIEIAMKLLQNYHNHDGLVVLHGTDTMAFTASALSYLLGRGVSKPIIVTGSQVPLSKNRNDALMNLITSVTIAATEKMSEVSLFFNTNLIRGNRSVKVSASDFPAFDSPNYAPLGTAGIEIKVKPYPSKLEPPPDCISLQKEENAKALETELKKWQCRVEDFSVISIILFPGIRASTVKAMLDKTEPKVKGVIIQAFGAGNAPGNPELLGALRDAYDDGVVLVDVTQVVKGTVDLDAYESASGLVQAGVTSGYDLTPEAALAKLVCLIAKEGDHPGKIAEKMQDPELGDLSLEVKVAWNQHWKALSKKRGRSHSANLLRTRTKKRKAERLEKE
jgi:L-asparaginase